MWGNFPENVCPCSRHHTPIPHRLNRHHVLPQSWGGKTVMDNLIDICPTTHVNVHMLIDIYNQTQGAPSAVTLRSYNNLARRLAKWAWDHRPSDNPPITSMLTPEGHHHP